MNRYPLWKNLLIIAVMIAGVIYALPNLFGEYPALPVTHRTDDHAPVSATRSATPPSPGRGGGGAAVARPL